MSRMESQRALWRKTAVAAAAATLFGAGPALANGGDFFAEMLAQMDIRPDAGPDYFGFIRDESGRVVPRAVVSAIIRPSGSAMTVQSNILGYYRIPGFSKVVDPETVEISCSKPGYRQVAADRRVHKPGTNTPIEVNCVLAPEEGVS